MERKISFGVMAGVIAVFAVLFTYITYTNLMLKKEHLRKIMINRGEAIIDSFEAASREISKGDYRRKFWIQKLLIETSRLPAIKYIFISSPEGKILARSNEANTDYSELEKLAREEKGKDSALWKILKGKVDETLVVYRKLSPAFSPKKSSSKTNDSDSRKTKEHMRRMNRMNMMRVKPDPGLVIRFFYRDSQILKFNPNDLTLFLAMDMNKVYDTAMIKSKKDAVFSGLVLFFLSSSATLLLFFIQNYRSARISLGRARRFSNLIIDTMPTGFVTVDPFLNVLSCNDWAMEMFGEMFGNKNRKVLLPEEIKNVISVIEEEDIKGKTINQEVIAQTGKGKKHFDLTMSYIDAGIDDTPAILILIKDETEKNALKKDIALNERLVTVGKLAAGVAHEIRNPLSSIKGFSTCILENPGNFDQNADISKFIIKEVERLDKVVGQLLDFSKPMKLIKEKTDIKVLVEESILLADAKSLGKRFFFRDHVENVELDIDRDKIKQVMLNLLLNAMDAVDIGGEISVSSYLEEHNLILSFTDSGAGIPDDILAHVFDPYYTTKSSGTGLGLAISRNIVNAHGGKIFVRNEGEHKTVFYIRLPLKGENR